MPFGFRIDRQTDEDTLNPLDTLFTFLNNDAVAPAEMQAIANVVFDAHSGLYQTEYKKPKIMNSFSVNNLNVYIPWETFASCFDDTAHVTVNGKTLFKAWQRKLVPVPGKECCFRQADFGWEPIWYDLESFLKNGEYSGYLTEKELVEWQKSEK